MVSWTWKPPSSAAVAQQGWQWNSLYETHSHPIRCDFLLQKCWWCSQRGQSLRSPCCTLRVTSSLGSPLQQRWGHQADWSGRGGLAQTPTCTYFNTVISLHYQNRSLGRWAVQTLNNAANTTAGLGTSSSPAAWEEKIKLLAKWVAVFFMYMCNWESFSYKERV